MGKMFFTVCCVLPVMLYGQGLAVSADKMNVAYVGVDNPLTIVVEKYKCSQLIISCDENALTKTEDCGYIYHPEIAGNHNIYIKVKTREGIKELGTAVIRARLIPDPVVRLGNTGHPGSRLFRNGPVITLVDFAFDVRFVVKDFTFEVIRKNGETKSFFNEGPLYNEKIKAQIDSCVPGDKIKISNVHCVGPDQLMRTINNACYNIGDL